MFPRKIGGNTAPPASSRYAGSSYGASAQGSSSQSASLQNPLGLPRRVAATPLGGHRNMAPAVPQLGLAASGPLRVLDSLQARRSIERFASNLDALESAGKAPSERLADTRIMINRLRGARLDGKITLAHFSANEPTGLMTVAPPPASAANEPLAQRYAKVDAIVTHPDSKGIGRKLMEQAVAAAASDAWRCGGKVRVFLESDGPVKAYEAMGFVPDPRKPNTMVLDPDDSPAWTNASGSWRLR